jgi:hypothetical protein
MLKDGEEQHRAWYSNAIGRLGDDLDNKYFSSARDIFSNIQNRLKNEKLLPKEELDRYRTDLAQMGYKLVGDARQEYSYNKRLLRKGHALLRKSHKPHHYNPALEKRGNELLKGARQKLPYNEQDDDILRFSNKYLTHRSSGLEKAITVISLGAVIIGMAIGYPALTGNVVAENVKNSIISGSMLFVLGLLGVFVANKK